MNQMLTKQHRFRYYEQEAQQYDIAQLGQDLSFAETEDSFFVSKSKIPKRVLMRTNELVYLIEFLKCDGTLSIIKRPTHFIGSVIFSSTHKDYSAVLYTLLSKQFDGMPITKRKDGFKISSLALSVLLTSMYSVPVGRKTLVSKTCISPRSLEEAQMIARAIIDTEGHFEKYAGDIVIGNQDKQYLSSYQNVIKQWFDINTIPLSPSKGWTYTNRISISKDADVLKIQKIRLLNPSKQSQLNLFAKSIHEYSNSRDILRQKVAEQFTSPKTILEVSSILKITPNIVLRIMKTLKCRRVSKRGLKTVFLLDQIP